MGKPKLLFAFPSNYSLRLFRLVSELFACDRQTDNEDHYYSWPHIVADQLITLLITLGLHISPRQPISAIYTQSCSEYNLTI